MKNIEKRWTGPSLFLLKTENCLESVLLPTEPMSVLSLTLVVRSFSKLASFRRFLSKKRGISSTSFALEAADALDGFRFFDPGREGEIYTYLNTN